MAMARNVATCFALVAMLMTVAKAATYTVGDTDGWSTGVDYPTWASTKTFVVNDTLVFKYLLNHDVLEVTKADYDSCSSSSPINTYNGGSTTVTLKTAGKHYFICGTSGHCSQGQQLEVDTSASSSSSPPPPSTTTGTPPPPSTTTGTPPPPSTTTGTSPPPPSSTNPSPPPPAGSSAYRFSYGASFGFALIILAAI